MNRTRENRDGKGVCCGIMDGGKIPFVIDGIFRGKAGRYAKKTQKFSNFEKKWG